MDILDAVKICLFNKYIDFKSRATRSEFWYFALFELITTTVASMIDMNFPGMVISFHLITNIILFLPGLAVSVRRLHDVNRSGYWLLLMFTIIGILIIFYWSVRKGNNEENYYGPVQH